MMIHECKEEFEIQKMRLNYCVEKAYNKCYGNNPMIFQVWFEDKDGIENFFDNYVEVEVKFCPYCGCKASSKSGLQESI